MYCNVCTHTDLTERDHSTCRHPVCPSSLFKDKEEYLMSVKRDNCLWKIRTHAGYESYACVYFDENTREIIIREETPDGSVLGSYVRKRIEDAIPTN